MLSSRKLKIIICYENIKLLFFVLIKNIETKISRQLYKNIIQ